MGEGRTILLALPSNRPDWLVDSTEEREGTGAKVVVASSFSAIVELAADVLRGAGFEVLTLTGATKDRDRSDLVARSPSTRPIPPRSLYQQPDSRRRVYQTLDAADEMVVIDQPWISDQDDQLEPRIHRVSRIHQVTVYRLVSVGTIDFWMASLTDEQRETVSKASPRKLSEMLKEAKEEMAA